MALPTYNLSSVANSFAQKSNAENAYARIMGQGKAKRSPLNYSQSPNSIRQGGDFTNINTVGNLTPEQRIEMMAGRLWEKGEAELMATRKSAASMYDRFTAQQEAYAGLPSKYKTREPDPVNPIINSGFAGTIKPSNQQQLWVGNRERAAGKVLYDTGDINLYKKAWDSYTQNTTSNGRWAGYGN